MNSVLVTEKSSPAQSHEFEVWGVLPASDMTNLNEYLRHLPSLFNSTANWNLVMISHIQHRYLHTSQCERIWGLATVCECFASAQALYDKAYQLHLPADEAQQMRLSSPEVLVLKLDTINLTVSFRQASIHVYHFVEAICRWMSDTGELE